MMEEQVSKKTKIKKILVAVFGVIMLFVIYMSVTHYIDTHTWVIISFAEEVDAEICEVFTGEQEVLKGDEIYLSVSNATVEDIKRDGSVVISFSSEVIDCKSGESITTAVLKSGEDSLTVRKGYENGHSAVATLWLIGCRRE